MAASISQNKIELTRGDTLRATVSLVQRNGGTYTPVEGDTIRFALKRKKLNDTRSDYTDKTPLLIKEVPISTLVLELEPNDTKTLGFGAYVYDMEIIYANGDVETFITSSDFNLTPEVY